MLLLQASFSLNVDTKILAKVLACRLENVLPLIISEDQTGFIKNRQPYFNIHRLFNLLYTPSDAVPELQCLSVSSLWMRKKPFDRVEWAYLFKVLEEFDFGPRFISWIKPL